MTADPLVAMLVTAVRSAPADAAMLHDRYVRTAPSHEGTPATSADGVIDELRAVGATLAADIRSLGIVVGELDPAPPRFSTDYGAAELTVGQICAVLARAEEHAVRQAVARIQECISIAQVEAVLRGLTTHLHETVDTVDALVADSTRV